VDQPQQDYSQIESINDQPKAEELTPIVQEVRSEEEELKVAA